MQTHAIIISDNNEYNDLLRVVIRRFTKNDLVCKLTKNKIPSITHIILRYF